MSQLTKDQQAAADAFFAFLIKEEKSFVLSGKAGAGKTYTMAHLKNTVMDEYRSSCKMMGVDEEYSEVVFTATTNKAAEVLEKATGETTQTIHSFLGLKVFDDHKTGKTKITKTNRSTNHSGKIIFIDESSMIDSVLFDIIDELTQGSKVIFVGDHAQMAPVNEEISPIYLNVDPHNFVFLGEPVRNAGTPALVDLCSQLRETVETGVFRPIKVVPGVIEYLEPREMEHAVKGCFSDYNDNARILCYTNSRVLQYNQHIRELRGKSSLYEEGDVLVVASAYAQGKSYLNVEREVDVTYAGTQIKDGGYNNLANGFAGPLQYYEVEVQTRSGPLQVVRGRIPVDPAHHKAVMQHFSRRKMWQEYFALKNQYMDLRDRDACTVYKSQGSTFETVFIDIGNIGTSRDAAQVARMLFVGVSRATSKVYLYGHLPGRYVGQEAA